MACSSSEEFYFPFRGFIFLTLFLLQAVTPQFDIARIMDTWTRQMGYPVLSYTVNGNELTVRQSRFLSDPNSNATVTPSPYGYRNFESRFITFICIP